MRQIVAASVQSVWPTGYGGSCGLTIGESRTENGVLKNWRSVRQATWMTLLSGFVFCPSILTMRMLSVRSSVPARVLVV